MGVALRERRPFDFLDVPRRIRHSQKEIPMSVALDIRPATDQPATGIDGQARVAQDLRSCLADSYVLMTKTLAYHWNVVGPLFHSVHELTEEQYDDLFKAIDDLAERIRALGHVAPSSMQEMLNDTVLHEDSGHPSTRDMLTNLVRDHETVARRFRESVLHAEEEKDVVTADLLTERLAFHEKSIWMLRAILLD
jgi:starvation-inducible DNA-binding protein